MAMVLVRRLLRAASPNQSRGGGGARGSAVHASGAAPRQVEIRTDREGGSGIARRRRRLLCLFVLFGRVMSDSPSTGGC